MVSHTQDGIEFTGNSFRNITVAIVVVSAIFSAGAAYAGTQFALANKVESKDFQVYMEQAALERQELRIAMQQRSAEANDDRSRLREICLAVKAGCR